MGSLAMYTVNDPEEMQQSLKQARVTEERDASGMDADDASFRKGRLLSSVIPAGSSGHWEHVATSLRKVPFLEPLPDAELQLVARSLELTEYRKDEIIVKDGNTSEDGLYILWEGGAVAEKDGENFCDYNCGSHFGARERGLRWRLAVQ
jgi:hypothetical protein